MLVLRYLIWSIALLICVDAELSIKDRIKLHKEWLAKRNALAKKQGDNNETAQKKITYVRKIIKFRNPSEAMSENDVAFVPHLKSEPRIVPLTSHNSVDNGPDDNKGSAEGSNKSNESDNNERLSEKQSGSFEKWQKNETNRMENRHSNMIDTTTVTMLPQPPSTIEARTVETTTTTTTTAAAVRSEMTFPTYSTPTTQPTFDYRTESTTTEVIKTTSTPRPDTIHLRSNESPIVVSKKSWGPWSKFSSCSRTCGGGVKAQLRNCIKREYINGKKKHTSIIPTHDCIGVFKRYHLCNEQPCSDENGDFRDEQCKRFNDKVFEGEQYSWEAYVKPDAECELNCKPIGVQYYATLNQTVIDGTLCTKPAENHRRPFSGKAICVEGVCKAVHKSGVISGAFMNNGAVRCGDQICRPVSGLFTKNPLPEGYVHVATIPTGASNITITELKNSMNLLVLKTADQRFLLNGDYTVSLSGFYDAAGSMFDYRRIDGLTNGSSASFNRKIESVTEWITCLGPTTESVHLMVLAKVHNPGVKYEYLLPVSPNSISTSEEDISSDTSAEVDPTMQNVIKAGDQKNSTTKVLKKRKFLWKIVGFSSCSKTCGGGVKTPVIRCVREAPTRVFSPKRCAHLKQPELNEHALKCNTKPCPAYWKMGEWSDCNCGNYDEEVYRSREVKCVQELTSGIVIQVNSGACVEDEAPDRELCECLKQLKTPELEVYKYTPGSRKKKKEQDKPRISIISNNTITKREHVKKAGVWLSSDWTEQCSAVCGVGLQFRSIFCDRNASPQNERCDLRFTPETTRECLSDEKCAFGEWFSGPWSKCSGDCFNLTRSRSAVCIKNDAFAGDEDCSGIDKPLTFENCKTSDVNYCKPKWHYSDWSECTKPCDSGSQRRTYKCLEPDIEKNEMRESTKCRYAEREISYRTCNPHACTEIRPTTPEPTVDLIQNDSCQDEFPNCHRVMKARLCSYSYYNKRCCHTCRQQSNELY